MALALAAVGACQPDGCSCDDNSGSGPPFAILEFHDEDGVLLDGRIGAPGNHVGYRQGELSTNVTGRQLGGIDVRLRGPNGQTEPHPYTPGRNEALIFALDPRRHLDLLENAAESDLLDDSESAWPGVTRGWPAARALPYPRNEFEPFSDFTSTTLDYSSFWLTGAPTGVAIDDGINIEAAYVYDHGACSAVQGVGGFLQQGLVAATQTLFCEVIVGANISGSLNREWLHAVTTLRDGVSEPGDLRGGVLLNANFDINVDFQVPVLCDVGAHLGYKGTFGLDDGILVLEGTTFVQDIYPVGIPPFTCPPDAAIAIEALDGLLDPVAEGLEANVRSAALAAQTQVVGAVTECELDDVSPCVTAANFFAVGVEIGADALEDDLGDASFFTLAEVNEMVGVAQNLSNWSCAPDGTGGRQCEYKIPAKRLNPLPEGVELVWFDGKEPSNPAYVLWVAIQGILEDDPQGGATALAQLCQPRTLAVGGDPSFPRAFADVSRPPCIDCRNTDADLIDFNCP